MKYKSLNAILACVVLLCSSFLANAGLIGRFSYTDGGQDYQAYYDDIIDITWSLPYNILTYDDGFDWAESYTLGSIDDWRLASVDEFRHLYVDYNIRSNQPNIFSKHITCRWQAHLQGCLVDGGQYYTSDIHSYIAPDNEVIENPLRYSFQSNLTFIGGSRYGGWAVTTGDVFSSKVPEPSTLVIFTLGLMGLALLRKKKA